jgi:hypothetical protein
MAERKDAPMITARTAMYGVGGALLVAYLAAANMPGGEARPPRDRSPAAPASGRESLATEVRSQAVRLHERIAQAPVPDRSSRNPFVFGMAPAPPPSRVARAAVAEEPAPVVVPPPALTLMGIAEEKLPQGVRRTAIVGGEGDTIFMVTEGQPVGERYKVTRIGADAIELEDVVTHGYRRLAMR